jgi:DNA-binding transcriptional LysR family regulator
LVRRLLEIDLAVHITVPSLLHLPLVLRGTRLVATLPERVANMFAATLPVKTFPLPFDTPPLDEILLWHKRNDADPAHIWLRDMVVRLTQEM